ncbi:fasciclin domain-containing protein [Nocardioides marmoriginsengisoli]|uniref:Fasciclin domain-containing protein n=1 Tax=Nocardioides marmoriginsengisoli TaxID=661483 RepID=A0A3N0CP31_9ACTN|nr:fasciclin domain-containing protein [Nocardioides marmoriginsengisoli]RNL65222.1 fasciclin domain-containing protein [Nocardioides marmoriginsengisoli]
MSSSILRRTGAIASITLALSFGLAACGDDDSDSGSTGTDGSSAPAAAGENFGAGCAAVPTEGPGSFNGMATAQVATAASSNPVLSTLVAAVKAADLVDTLNSAEALTVFAPADSAFAKIPSKTLNGLIADVPALTKVLQHHVIAGKIAPADLAGEHETLAGDKITVVGSGEDFTVDGATVKSKVVCGNVQTANATVYIIDTVLTD